ncbi:NAD(P)-binding protein [Trichoderma citrinoviride]|uniref:NAD(P)-binding protein n=1 Tax=Trichoderma citrinoviride TaxID=58853 RepID=A0A2T4AYJ6_9HYPO|nr:NAD(P)-binding protein [Trichoderma citrinoviride]PTB62143.1 NAD(P)-binding protein [Trichoderma citrinoviride]
MTSQLVSKICVIGGTGVQGMSIVKALVHDKKYTARLLTRDTSSRRAAELLALGNVELLQGTFASEEALRDGYRGCDGAFANIDGFDGGERGEMYWAIRAHELAIEEGIKSFVYGSLPYVLKLGGYDSRFYSGHMNEVGAALFTVAPYMDMTIGSHTPMAPTIEDDTLTWRVPLGNSSMPLGSLEDCGYYVRLQFDNPERANGLDLRTAAQGITYSDLAIAFERPTGYRARYIDVDPSAMSSQRNFTALWNSFRHGLFGIDYALLDQIQPNRVKRAEDWSRQQDNLLKNSGKGGLWERLQPGNITLVIKRSEDGGHL